MWVAYDWIDSACSYLAYCWIWLVGGTKPEVGPYLRTCRRSPLACRRSNALQATHRTHQILANRLRLEQHEAIILNILISGFSMPLKSEEDTHVDGWDHGERILGEELFLVLLALRDVDDDELVWDPDLLANENDRVDVGRDVQAKDLDRVGRS